MQGNDKFTGADDDFEATPAEDSAAREQLQMTRNLSGHATGTANEREEDKSEENTERNCMQPARNPVEQATGEVETIFEGGNSWGNKSAPPLDPQTLGIPGGAALMITQQARTLPEGGNAPMAETTSQNLHRALMEVNTTLHNTVVRGNGMGGATGTAAAPPSAPSAVQKQCVGRRIMGWSVLTEAVKLFGPAATTQEFSKNY